MITLYRIMHRPQSSFWKQIALFNTLKKAQDYLDSMEDKKGMVIYKFQLKSPDEIEKIFKDIPMNPQPIKK